MKIESIDFFYISMPVVTDAGDGSQDALLVRVRAGGIEARARSYSARTSFRRKRDQGSVAAAIDRDRRPCHRGRAGRSGQPIG